MQKIKFDFNNMFSFNLGTRDGVAPAELKQLSGKTLKAHSHLKKLINSAENRTNLGLEWTQLPFLHKSSITEIQQIGEEIARKYQNVIFLGIGGSYLGLKAALDALCPPYYNEFGFLKKRPRIYFEGNNLDPDTMSILLKNLNPNKTFAVVISKSGETTETKVALDIIEQWLKRGAGAKYGRQILAITDPESGSLRQKVIKEQLKDKLSFRSLPLLMGVGGRYSELNMGLLHLAIIGVKIEEVLAGARSMAERCGSKSVFKNPALMYAALHTILYQKKNKSIAVMMPFSETLKATADWYSQLLAESLGKKFAREIRVTHLGLEKWDEDKRKILNSGRTPVATRGTSDLHSIHQNNVEGENNKSITFIRVEKFRIDLKVPETGDFLSNRSYSELIRLAQEATGWSLSREKRPNCTVILPQVTPFNWGELIFFFEMATAYEGELLNVNAFDQPGVEGYKNYMYYKLGKPGVKEDFQKELRRHPLVKKEEFIL
jgi:glucose-6-phosphate isomerase